MQHFRVVERPWRIAGYSGAALAAMLGGLVVAGAVFEPATRDQVAARIAESLAGQVAIERTDLALVRGRFELSGLAVRRAGEPDGAARGGDDAAGTLAIDVAAVRCELAPLGLALVDRGCRTLALAGLHVTASSLAVFQLRRPRRPPLVVGRVVLDDAQLVVGQGAGEQALGRITIAHAEAGATTLRTPLSWLLALRELDAVIELPAGIAIAVSYRDGTLRAAGALLGAAAVAVPVALPVADPAEDPAAEVARLAAFGKEIALRLALRRTSDWLESTLAH